MKHSLKPNLKKNQENEFLRNFTIYISFHQANSIERKYLFRCCVKSAILQGCKVVLIHDNSSNKEELLYAKKLGIELHEMENIPDVGISKFLEAFKICETKYLSFLQDDDWYALEKTRMIGNILEQLSKMNYEFSLIITDIRIIENGIEKGIWTLGNNFLVPPSKWIINKDLVKKIGVIPNCPWGWDKAIAFQLLSKGDVLHIQSPLIYYNFHEEQATHKAFSNYTKEDKKEIADYIKGLPLKKIYVYNNNMIKIHGHLRVLIMIINKLLKKFLPKLNIE